MIRAAVFDFGETLLSEERAWGVWAEWVGVTKQELFAAIGATIELRAPHVHALELCKPGFDLGQALAEREALGIPRHEELYDVYPDAEAALDRLRAAGLRVGVAGNQPSGAEAALGAIVIGPRDFIATSTDWGVSKPSPAFFERLAYELGFPAEEIAYIGDRVDNDVVPAAAAGMFAVHLRRGPWGIVQAAWPEAARARASAANLGEAVDAILSPGR
ncbi:HAD family hydrolase [Solirubrobacter sp. CPCC 204708]|uniref:HAD family hydrolase n=1 Tax=Solirubrobacter deserti TaxID=2282478 RepID=A0ABT4RRT3_9ACTN|nr:HAD family hydrolase [Solirubrobacter deserti]MBE2317599.1 HAD family hydrolase [Solirubrobacter deserti]MDA0141293.1 HAD family hydrolase [Solirubrobacter deserti]